MLHGYVIESPDQKQELFQSWALENNDWVVNDLESKFWVQRLLRQRNQGITAIDRVQRASELWLTILLKMDPSWQALTPAVAELFVEKWVSEILKSHSFHLSIKDTARAYATMGQVLPLMSHFYGNDAIVEWFAENPDARDRWGDWFQLSQLLWQKFIEQKIIPQDWVKAVLINEELPNITSEKMIFDLGLDMDDVESELILNLSREQDVHVIIPKVMEQNSIYDNLMARCQLNPMDFLEQPIAKTYLKLPSMLAEVKQAVSQVRQWLDQGVEPQKIIISSPQIETYWPTLVDHLQVEGIPVQKDVVTPLSQLPHFQDLMARVRLLVQQIVPGDGEQIVYSTETAPDLDYSEFQSLFTNVYDVSDFSRSEKIKNHFPKGVDPKLLMTFEDFLNFLAEQLPNHSLKTLEYFLQKLDEVFLVKDPISVERWVQFLEKHLTRSEKKIKLGHDDGILVLPLASSFNPPVHKAIVLGLAENQLKETKNTALSWLDVESIKLNFGFNLAHEDNHLLESYLQWFDRKIVEEVVYLNAEADFTGSYQSSSLYWMKGAMDNGDALSLTSPQVTRWDELLMWEPDKACSLTESSLNNCIEFIQRDVGEIDTEPVPYQSLSLSASAVDEFIKCPFRLFARKALRLRNPGLLDLDVDPMNRGRLLHKICEWIIEENNLSLSNEQIDQWLEKAMTEIEMEVYSADTWAFVKPYYIHIISQFLDFERQWRQDYPDTHTLALEKKIKSAIHLENQQVFFHPQKGIPFYGVIDRVDRSSKGEVVILDYKTSGSGLTTYKSWLKNGQFQLLIYYLALIDSGVLPQGDEVVGAFYYALKTQERSKGFSLEGVSPEYLPKGKMKKEEHQPYLDEARSLLYQTIEKIQRGETRPSPRQGDTRICQQCDWKKICRSPELNQ